MGKKRDAFVLTIVRKHLSEEIRDKSRKKGESQVPDCLTAGEQGDRCICGHTYLAHQGEGKKRAAKNTGGTTTEKKKKNVKRGINTRGETILGGKELSNRA